MRIAKWLGVAALSSFSLLGCGDPVEEDSSDVTSGMDETTDEAQALRALLNDPATTKEVLVASKLSSSIAKAIVAHRDGPDGLARTADDDVFETVREVDDISGIGPATLTKLVKIATDKGYLAAEQAKDRSVIFSPQPAAASHNAEIAKRIAAAKKTIDIAMYSYSDAGIATALSDAIKRGVKVRMVFDTASDDRKLTGTALTGSKSGKLEAMGVDVRWVNKIMHHKFMIVDGPRDDAGAAETATLVTGSGNWSNGAATIYDENTLFLTAYPKLALVYQREFNLMWEHSKDVASNPAITFEASTLAINDEMIPVAPGMNVFLTSKNFPVSGSTFSSTGTNTVADELVRAIDAATKRIHIASGHMRSRPVAEALMRKATEHPEVDVRIYLDAQEYISDSGNAQQKADREKCLAAATTDAKQRACLDKDYLYGRDIEKAGAIVRYKFYSYRWDASYAAQMHDKIFIVDDTLYTGSYNLSDNAEHNTFENVLALSGPEFADLVEAYDAQLTKIWSTGEGLLAPLRDAMASKATIDLVFPPMALTWTEARDLKTLIQTQCPAVNSADYRQNPAAHKRCTK